MSNVLAKTSPRAALEEVSYAGLQIGGSIAWKLVIVLSVLYDGGRLLLAAAVVGYLAGSPDWGAVLLAALMSVGWFAQVLIMPSPLVQAIRLRQFRHHHPDAPLPQHRRVTHPAWPALDDGESERVIAWTDQGRVPGYVQTATQGLRSAARFQVVLFAVAIGCAVVMPTALGSTGALQVSPQGRQVIQWIVIGSAPFVALSLWTNRHILTTAALLHQVQKRHPRAVAMRVSVANAERKVWRGEPARAGRLRGILCLTPTGIELWSWRRAPVVLREQAWIEDLCWTPLGEYLGVVNEDGVAWFRLHPWFGNGETTSHLSPRSHQWMTDLLARDPWIPPESTPSTRAAREAQVRHLTLSALDGARRTRLAPVLRAYGMLAFAIVIPIVLAAVQLRHQAEMAPGPGKGITDGVAIIAAMVWLINVAVWWLSLDAPTLRLFLKRQRLERQNPEARILVLAIGWISHWSLWRGPLGRGEQPRTVLATIDQRGLTLVPLSKGAPLALTWENTSVISYDLNHDGDHDGGASASGHTPVGAKGTIEIVIAPDSPGLRGGTATPARRVPATVLAGDSWARTMPEESRRAVAAVVVS